MLDSQVFAGIKINANDIAKFNIEKTIDFISINISVIDNVYWEISHYDKEEYWYGSKIWGLAHTSNYIEIFQTNQIEYVASHEIGHLIRFNYVTNQELFEYYALRGSPSENFFDTPEELFAEDFACLFGLYNIKFRPSIEEPGFKEKEWILSKIKS